jgi:hypothetical protein
MLAERYMVLTVRLTIVIIDDVHDVFHNFDSGGKSRVVETILKTSTRKSDFGKGFEAHDNGGVLGDAHGKVDELVKEAHLALENDPFLLGILAHEVIGVHTRNLLNFEVKELIGLGVALGLND